MVIDAQSCEARANRPTYVWQHILLGTNLQDAYSRLPDRNVTINDSLVTIGLSNMWTQPPPAMLPGRELIITIFKQFGTHPVAPPFRLHNGYPG